MVRLVAGMRLVEEVLDALSAQLLGLFLCCVSSFSLLT